MMRFQRVTVFRFISLILLLLNVGCGNAQPKSGSPENETNNQPQTKGKQSILEEVQQRGWLNCGIAGTLQGFSYVDVKDIDITKLDDELNNELINSAFYKNLPPPTGFDVDICKAIAAAIFDDPDAVQYRYLDTQERFEAISSRKIDVLSRTTTWTVERDVSIKIEFAPVIFYDGQGVLVRKDSGINSLNDLNGKTVCVEVETTTKKNLEDEKKKRGLTYNIKALPSQKDVYRLYKKGECQAVTSDRSQLAAKKVSLTNPDAHIILPEIISKEPLAPAVIDSDIEWIEIIRWIVFTLIEAEELEITRGNLEQMKANNDPKIIRFLGLEANTETIGSRLNLSPDYAQRIIKHVGNYGEIYERNLGPKSSTPIERGLNHLWNNQEKRGLMYSPPFR